MQASVLTDFWATIEGLPSWQGFLVVTVLSLVTAKLIQVGGDRVLRRLTKRIPGEVDDIVFGSIHPPLYVTVFVVGQLLAIEQLGIAASYYGQLEAGTFTFVTVMWAFALTRMGRRVSAAATDDDRFDRQVVPIFQNVWTAVILGATAFLVLSFWKIDVTPLLASAGILGIIIGLAARDTVANFFGSIALYFDGTYKVGDFVVIESGERGRVEDISIRSTVIRTRDDMLVTVPNSVLNTATIVNESNPKRERRVRVPVGVAYGTDLDLVEETLLEVADESDLVLEKPSPRVRFRGFGDSAVDVELLGWMADPVLRGRATHDLVKDVYRAFMESDIEIPFPQRDISVSVDGDGVPDLGGLSGRANAAGDGVAND
ncbi:MAG: mechanosensitive ion channel family protein [Haloarculaceae archaeon]